MLTIAGGLPYAWDFEIKGKSRKAWHCRLYLLRTLTNGIVYKEYIGTVFLIVYT